MKVSFAFRFALALTLALAPGAASRAGQDEVEVSTFYQGEFDRPTYSLWGPRLACGINLDEWANARCRGRRAIYRPVTDSVGGNRCGYQGFALVCFNK